MNSIGKKDQLITRLLIRTRDEISNSVEAGCHTINDTQGDNDVSPHRDGTNKTSDSPENDNSCHLDSTHVPECSILFNEANEKQTFQMMELSDDSSSDDVSCDELDIIKSTTPPPVKIVKSRGGSSLHETLEEYFGYTDFREGQEWAIRRCLHHNRTLLVAPTGQGKSLCYALPAAIMDGICLVVSPLISLMQVSIS